MPIWRRTVIDYIVEGTLLTYDSDKEFYEKTDFRSKVFIYISGTT